MCCEKHPCEVEVTLENEERLTRPDVEEKCVSLLTFTLKERCPGQGDTSGIVWKENPPKKDVDLKKKKADRLGEVWSKVTDNSPYMGSQ